MKHISKKGFTLIELLIVIAIIGIIAAVAFVALNPLQRFADARDSARWSDVTAVLSAVKIDQVDNGGNYLNAIRTTTIGTPYMIGTTGCDTTCDDVSGIGASDCVDVSGLVTEGYLAEVPVSPNGDGTWSSATTGYTLTRSTSTVEIKACESEGSGISEITVKR